MGIQLNSEITREDHGFKELLKRLKSLEGGIEAGIDGIPEDTNFRRGQDQQFYEETIYLLLRELESNQYWAVLELVKAAVVDYLVFGRSMTKKLNRAGELMQKTMQAQTNKKAQNDSLKKAIQFKVIK